MPDTNTTIPVRATASADPGAPWWVALLAGAVALIAGLGRRRHPAWRAAPDVPANLASFSRHLRAENKAPSTIVTYSKAVTQLDAFLERSHRPRAVAELRREDVEAFHLDLQDAARQPATVAQRFRSLQQFFKWLAEEGEIERNPMATMNPPQVPETPRPVLREDDLRKILDACGGTGFEERRDNAIIRLFLDTGMRRGELASQRARGRRLRLRLRPGCRYSWNVCQGRRD